MLTKDTLKFAGLIIATTALMGSSFAIGKIGLQFISPFLLVAVRFLIAGIVMAIIVRHRPLPQHIGDWVRVGIIGLFQTAGVMGMIFLSLETISAGESSILTFVNPLLVVILATIFTKARYTLRQYMGVLLGFFGVVVTLGGNFSIHMGVVYGFTGALSWAIATLLIKRWGARFDIWILTAYQMMIGGLILMIAAVNLETPRFVVNMESIVIVLWLALMASVVQFGIWFYLLHHNDPGKVSAFLFLAPFFGVLFGWLLLHEIITQTVMLGGLLIIGGIILVNWPTRTFPVHAVKNCPD
ncbi:DMT family transporter [Sulfobacillus thermosulfidooxidans]|uniref:DMT family transporter n=1 Tax=Sulfobacillus thermosulfidooxidans TaxID=28034 RepID=UPI00096B69B3|nr:EamA family transporter [Sulfobacillus thermosulfidooxidans]